MCAILLKLRYVTILETVHVTYISILLRDHFTCCVLR